jgi:probable HAF family extracellular repeat protein
LSAVVLLLVATAISWSQQPSLTWLGTLPGFVGSEAWGVSADGSVVVGRASNAERQSRAFRWTAAGGMQDLGTLPGGGESEAWGVSADGRVVVGMAYTAAGRWRRAFRWTAAGGMEDLGTLGGVESWAFGISADGRVVVGKAQNAAWQYRAFRWTEAGGMEDLNITYASLLTDGSYLWRATAISPDGRYIVGLGSRGAFLLDTGFPLRGDVDRNGCVDDADLLRVLFAFGGQGYRNEDLNWDGVIDDADLLVVLFNFGSGC